MNCLVYQSIKTPEGLMFCLYGPVKGLRPDLTLHRQRGWEDVLQHCLTIDEEYHYIYGDSAYLIRPLLQVPYIYGLRNSNQKAFNAKISSVRVEAQHN